MPLLYVLAGCNGSGKTTLMHSCDLFRDVTKLDPDALFADFGSWEKVITRIDEALRSRHDIVLETTLSGRTILKRLALAKEHDYTIHLTFIGTSSATLNIGRIDTRTYLGGHAISAEDVQRRWSKALINLPTALALSDTGLVLDNSEDDEHRFTRVAKIQRGEVTIGEDIPDWLEEPLSRFHGRTRSL